jgi:hypothetical protein
MAQRTKGKARRRKSDELTWDEKRRRLNLDDMPARSPSKVADLIPNRKVPSGEHPEGTAPPIERLTDEEKRKTDWSDVT